VLTNEQLEAVWRMLVLDYATGEPRIAREKRKGNGAVVSDDPVAQWLLANWETYGDGEDGRVFIECPYSDEHTSDSGPSSTAYFPAGTGGYAQGHFVCLHAHCVGRDDQEFLDATGFNVAQFTDLTADPGEVGVAPDQGIAGGSASEPAVHGLAGRAFLPAPTVFSNDRGEWPTMVRNSKGEIDATAENIVAAVQQGGMTYRHVAYDAFTDNLCWAFFDRPREEAQWKLFRDEDMTAIRIELERRGFKPMGKELLRDGIYAAAKRNQLDSAVEWLARQRWDGIPRVERFAIDYWGWADTPYARAVGYYVWTALAGRVLQPGVRADMAPILVGAQGIRKTSIIQAMAPNEDMYAEIRLDDRDADLSRKLRGKLVGELEELRGLNSRAIEEIKAFVSRRRESWVPKFKEFENFFWRRCLLIGSTNDTEFLADPTGERRWLPGECVNKVDVEGLLRDRENLWAEAAALFLMNGVMWEAAEKLAEQEHPRYKIGDTWERAISIWMGQPQIGDALPMDKGYITPGEVLSSALGVPLSQQDRRHEIRVTKALKSLRLREVTIHEGSTSFKAWERAQ
jgi:predicted P-loop ATPase